METQVCPSSRREWRDWLQQNHASEQGVWLVYFKKHTGRPTVSYRESVLEALCFGWIDGIMKSIDSERYCHRFSPRKKKSKWSGLNVRFARELIRQGKMTPAGLEAFERRQEYDETHLQGGSGEPPRLPPEIESALKENETAWNNFSALAPGYRRQYIGWLSSAKKDETRKRRLAKALKMLEQNQKPGM